MDIGSPDLPGLEATRETKRMNQEIAIVVLTLQDDREFLSKMLSIGASGFVPKPNNRVSKLTF